MLLVKMTNKLASYLMNRSHDDGLVDQLWRPGKRPLRLPRMKIASDNRCSKNWRENYVAKAGEIEEEKTMKTTPRDLQKAREK